MAKTSGLGDNFYVGGYNLSGDVGALGKVSGSQGVLDVTGIDKSAYERIGGLRSGDVEFTSFFNTATAHAHPVLSALPTANAHLMYCRGTTIGNTAACMVAKQINYDPTRAADGALTFAVQAQSNAYGLEWGNLLTAGQQTDASAANGTSVALVGANCVVLPGSAGDYVSTPDAASLDITGDIDILARIAADDWTPAADSYIVAKYNITGNQRSYALILASTGALILQWSNDGTATVTATSTVTTLSALAADDAKWVRATLDVDNGAGGYTATFYTSDDGTTWTQYGDAVVGGATTSIYAGTAVLELGSRNGGAASNFAGRIFEAEVRSGIGGTAVAHPIVGTSSVADATPLTWTVNGNAYLSNQTNYGWQAYLQVFSLSGTSVTITLQHSDDNSSWANLTGGAFTAVAAPGPGTQRLAGAATALVKRYLRVVSSGTFTNAVFAVTFVRNDTAVTF